MLLDLFSIESNLNKTRKPTILKTIKFFAMDSLKSILMSVNFSLGGQEEYWEVNILSILIELLTQ